MAPTSQLSFGITHPAKETMTIAEDTAGFEHRFVEVNGIKLHVVVGGTGPLVLLLHGWPEFWGTWRHVMKPLRDAGFTVAAPDLRGFNLSDKPTDVRAYKLEHVAADITDLVRVLGFERAHVIGHDWGGAAAWELAQNPPPFLDKVVVLNAMHAGLFEKRLKSSFEQMRASYYMFLFQVPWLSEKTLTRSDFKVIRDLIRTGALRPNAVDDEYVQACRDAIAQPGAVTAGLNYYRAAFQHQTPRTSKAIEKIRTPMLLLWGMNDVALPSGNLDGIEDYVENLTVHRIENCSHWVTREVPELVVERSLEFFRKPNATA